MAGDTIKQRVVRRGLVLGAAALLGLGLAGAGATAAAQGPQDRDYPQSDSQGYPQEQYPQQGSPQGYPQQYPQQYPQPYPQNGSQQSGGSQGQGAAQDDPSKAPGAARVSYIRGDVSTQRGDSGDWSAAALNAPLLAGDKISTGEGARAEVQLDYASVLRLNGNSEANIASLVNNRVQVQIGQGVANFTVMKGSQTDTEIDTANVSVHPLREGRYRVEVDSNGDTFVTVREGEADVSTPQGSTKVHKGDLITIRGTAQDAQYKVSGARSNDDFDKWNRDRDESLYNAQSWSHTNRYYTGSEDLDTNGVWSEVPDYGSVWTPAVEAGWAPYRSGRWVWEGYWGWTWVSYEPWGWAPYHYGRWFMNGGSWAWWPGPVHGGYRPVWAPAYVSFFGFGGAGVGIGFGGGFGSIAWLPIGPCDYFHPWWGGYRDHFGVAAYGNFGFRGGYGPLHGGGRFSNLNGLAENERLRAGISGVPSGNFGHGAIAPHGFSAAEVHEARMMTGNVPVVPGRDSLRVSDRSVGNTPGVRGGGPNRFFSRSANVGAGRPEAFSQQASHIQEGLQRNGGGLRQDVSGGGGVGGGARRGEFGGRVGEQGQGVEREGGQPSYRPQGAQGAAGNQGGRGAGSEGWNRFGGGQGRDQSPETGRGQVQGGGQGSPAAGAGSRVGDTGIYRGNSRGSYYGQGQPQGQERGQQQEQGGWQRFSQRGGGEPRAAERGAGGNQPSYRPPLDMNKPIVNERNGSGGNGGGQYSRQPAYQVSPNSRGGYPGGGPSVRSAPAPSAAPMYRSAPAAAAPSAPARGGPSVGSRGYSGGGGSGGGGGYRGGGGGNRGGGDGGRGRR